MLKFFFLFFYLVTSSIQARTIIITDIDDTIRQTNVLSKFHSAKSVVTSTPAFPALLDIYNHFNFHFLKTDLRFYYLSAAPVCLVGHDDWVEKKKLPVGPVYQRPCDVTWLRSEYTAIYKFKTILEIIDHNIFIYGVENTKVILFGDNAEHDPEVYRKILKEFGNILPISIYIRDIRVEATELDTELTVKKLDDVNYFLTENDLLDDANFEILPETLMNKIKFDFKSGKLFPKYLYANLARRYEVELGIGEKQAKIRAYEALSNLR